MPHRSAPRVLAIYTVCLLLSDNPALQIVLMAVYFATRYWKAMGLNGEGETDTIFIINEAWNLDSLVKTWSNRCVRSVMYRICI